MRDVLIHDYIGVDLDEVWNVASDRIPELQTALEQFLAGEGGAVTPTFFSISPIPSIIYSLPGPKPQISSAIN
jgi:hypothetical protein